MCPDRASNPGPLALWSDWCGFGGVMVLGKLPVPGRPTNLD